MCKPECCNVYRMDIMKAEAYKFLNGVSVILSEITDREMVLNGHLPVEPYTLNLTYSFRGDLLWQKQPLHF